MRLLPQPRLHHRYSPFLTRQIWDAEVTQMIKAFAAPISDADRKEIAEYLTKYYGQQP